MVTSTEAHPILKFFLDTADGHFPSADGGVSAVRQPRRLTVAEDDTTATLVCHVVRYLVVTSTWDRVRSDPNLLQSAIEEVLRFHGPVAGVSASREAGRCRRRCHHPRGGRALLSASAPEPRRGGLPRLGCVRSATRCRGKARRVRSRETPVSRREPGAPGGQDGRRVPARPPAEA